MAIRVTALATRVTALATRVTALAAVAAACASPVGEREEPMTPAAMVGLPSPVLASQPASEPAPSAPTPAPTAAAPTRIPDMRTRVIADPPPPKVHGRAIDLDVKGADLHDVLRLLADVGRVNIVVGDDVQGSITIRMKAVPWDEALDVIVRAKGLSAERDGNVIVVGKPR